MNQDTAELRVKSRGSGPPVVLLHGLFGNADTLGVLSRHLAEKWTVYALDLPGHGESSTSETLNLENMANAVLRSLAANNVVNAHLIGHSLGGKVVMQLAALQPNAVRSAVVLDIAPVDYEHGHRDIFAAVEGVQLDQYSSRAEINTALGEYVSDKDVRQFILTNLRRNEAGRYGWRIDFKALQRDYQHIASAPRLGALFAGPVLIIRGGDSPYVRAEHEFAFRQRFSECTFKTVNNTGHWLHAQKPHVVNSLISRFLEQLP